MIAFVAAAVLAGPQLSRLGNGIPIFIHPAPGEDRITLQALIRLDDATPAELGEANYIAGALFGETDNFSLRRFRELAWSIGGNVDSEMAGDCLRVEVATAKSHLLPAVDFLTDALKRPLFTEQALADGKTQVELLQKRMDENPQLQAVRNALAAVDAAAISVNAPTQRQAVAFHTRFFRPERVAISAVGDISAEEVAGAFSSLGGWSPSAAGSGEIASASQKHEPSLPVLVVCAPGPEPRHADFAAWLTACAALGCGKGSLLNREFRERRGITYSVGVDFAFRKGNSWAAFYVVLSKASDLDLSSLQNFIKSATLTESDLTRAKAFAAGEYEVGQPVDAGPMRAFAQGHAEPSEQAFWSSWWSLKGAPLSRDVDFAKLIGDVTLATANAQLRKMSQSLVTLYDYFL
ncbi:MAG TPA: insulinase family protein [Fimbriimonadales bacterium]|jgi:predicted Zn-dependent peptidase|nr:insulinase family protein [Fimbriimonadales bacterium]